MRFRDTSALCRRNREGSLDSRDVAAALRRLDLLRQSFVEVQPQEEVRDSARRLLRVHPLGAAAERRPADLPFVTLYSRLAEAARREGFPLLPDAD